MITRRFAFFTVICSLAAADIRLSDPIYKENSLYDYLIIVPDDKHIVKQFERLALSKWQKGLSTKIVTVDSISRDGRGVDIQEKIRNFLRDSRRDWGVTWVLLGGDYRLIPARKITTDQASPSDSFSFLSDAYYSCLDGEVETPGGYVFAGANSETVFKLECRYDEEGNFVCDRAVPELVGLDLWSDIYIGRMPVSNAEEAAVMIDKTLDYAAQPRDNDCESGALFFGPKIHNRVIREHNSIQAEITDAADYWHYEISPVFQGPRSILRRARVDELYEDRVAADGSIIPDSQQITVDGLQNSLSRGYNLVYFSAHGNPQHIWISSQQVVRYRLGNVLQLKSRAYSNIISISCSVMKMPAESTLCFAKSFLTNLDGGAVTYSGSSGDDYFSSKRYQYLYASRYLSDGSVTRISKAFQLANLRLDSYNKFVHQFWGDPELEIWTQSVGAGDTIGINAFRIRSKLRVQVSTERDSALVCVFKAGEIFRRGYTKNGFVEFDSLQWSARDVRITATLHNKLPGSIVIDLADISATGIAQIKPEKLRQNQYFAINSRAAYPARLRDLQGRTICTVNMSPAGNQSKSGVVSSGMYLIRPATNHTSIPPGILVK